MFYFWFLYFCTPIHYLVQFPGNCESSAETVELYRERTKFVQRTSLCNMKQTGTFLVKLHENNNDGKTLTIFMLIPKSAPDRSLTCLITCFNRNSSYPELRYRLYLYTFYLNIPTGLRLCGWNRQVQLVLYNLTYSHIFFRNFVLLRDTVE